MGRDANRVGSDDESVDVQALRDTAALVIRAPFRHKKLAVSIVALVMALGAFAGSRLKPKYQAEAAILVQRSVTLPNFADPSHPTQGADVDPIAGAADLVKGHENLLSIVRQTHLAARFPFPKAPPGQVSLSEEDKVEIMSKLVDSRLTISIEGGVVSFAATWTDPQTAYDLVSAVLHNFLEARNAAEVSIILDAIALLEEHANTEREGIDSAMEDFIRSKEGWKMAGSSSAILPGVPQRARAPGEMATPDPDLARRIEEKRQQIKEAEEERRRQLGELKTQLAGLLGTYTPSYPPVIALQRKIDALAEAPPNIVALKNAERGLLAELAAKAASRGMARPAGGLPLVIPPRAAPPASKQDLEIADPESAMALSRLQNRIHKYEEYMDQISAAKLQLDLAHSAFRYRYSVHQPPELPAAPRHSVRAIAGWGSAMLAVLLTLGVTAALDLASGRFLHPWQVRRRLSLPVLGEVTRP